MFARLPQVPTLRFAGATDPFAPRAAYERSRRWHTGPYEHVELPGGHFLHREHPERFNEELIRWLGAGPG